MSSQIADHGNPAKNVDAADILRLIDTLYQFASVPDEAESLFVLSDLLSDLMLHMTEDEGSPPGFLRSHIDRALAIAEKVGKAASDENTQPANRMLVDSDLHVVAIGSDVAALLSPIAGECKAGSRFVLANHGVQHRLEDSVHAVLRRGQAFDVVRLTEEGAALYALVRRDRGGAALTLLTTPRDDRVRDIVVAKHGLTRAEQRLLDLVEAGTGLKPAAAELGISYNTARNQLKSVFSKLGVKRQAELVHHLNLLNLLAALEFQSDQQGRELDVESPVFGAALKRYQTPDTLQLDDGRVLAWSTYGARDGEPVLFLNSPLAAPIMSARQQRVLERAGVSMICVHRPGFGSSSPDPQFSLSGFASDLTVLCNLLESNMGVSRFPLLAGSSAAPFALAAAAHPNSRVSAMGLISPRLSNRSTVSNAQINGVPIFAQALRARSWAIQFGYTVMKTRASQGWVQSMIERIYRASPVDQAYLAAHPDMRVLMVHSALLCLQSDAKTLAQEVEILRRGFYDALSSIKQPTAIWYGSKDGINPMQPNLEALAKIPNLHIHEVPNQGHLVLDANLEEIVVDLLAMSI